MEHLIVETGQRPQRKRKASSQVESEVSTLVKGWPVNEELWNHRIPQSQNDIIELFRELTLSGIPSETRQKMSYAELLETLAGMIDICSETQIVILFGACEVVINRGKLPTPTVYEIIGRVLGKPDRWLIRMRTATLKCLQLQDMLHEYGVVAFYTYLILECRES